MFHLILIKTLEWSFLWAPVYRFLRVLVFFILLRTDVVCWLHCLLYETSVLSRGATELQAAKTLRNPCEQRNNTPFDMRSGNTAKENKCFHCSEQDGEFLPSLLHMFLVWFSGRTSAPVPNRLQMSKAGKQWRLHWNLSGGSSRLLLGIPPTGLLLSFLPLIFFPSLRPPPFCTRELQTPRVNIIALKLKAPTSSPHSLAFEWDSMHFLITWPSLINT